MARGLLGEVSLEGNWGLGALPYLEPPLSTQQWVQLPADSPFSDGARQGRGVCLMLARPSWVVGGDRGQGT